MITRNDVAVVGSGPNGLAAAVTLARAGLDVTVFERGRSPGGGVRTAELMESGVWHDLCSAVHPMAVASPFFRDFRLSERVELITPPVSFAQASEEGVALVTQDLADLEDAPAWYGRELRWLARRLDTLNSLTLHGPPTVRSLGDVAAVAGLGAVVGSSVLRSRLRSSAANLVAGAAAHAGGAPGRVAANAVGTMLLAQAHGGGWPVVAGGSGAITDALIDDLVGHGGRVLTEHPVDSLQQLDGFGARILSVTPAELLRWDDRERRLPSSYRRSLSRFYVGPGVFKLDIVTSEPIPWTDPRLRRTPTVHIGSPSQVTAAMSAVSRGRHPDRPFVLLVQADLFDPSRTVPGRNAIWAYTHVPNKSAVDRTDAIQAEIERLAPGFRDTIVSSIATTAPELEAHNPNYPGGDILAGAITLRQTLARPVVSTTPWRTPLPRTYLASASTSPGPGVHGVAGYRAAQLLLAELHLPVPTLSSADGSRPPSREAAA